jgi:ParB family chromosome partitioning protein
MSLKNKAAKLDFSNLPGLGVDTEVPARPKTAPGAMMAFANEARSDLLRENEALQAQAQQAQALHGRLEEALTELRQWDGAKATRLIDAALIRPSRWANRHALNYSSPQFDKLKAEVADAGGNVQPIKVRPVAEPAGSFEVVYGHRRLEACRQLGLPVLCLVDNIEDRALFVEMERENRGRKDLSAWEQGMMYRRALDAALFPSLRQLAASIGVQPGNVSTALQIAAMPDAVVQAFASPLDLQFRWVAPLKAALERDEAGVLERARELAGSSPRPSAREVLARLTGQTEKSNLSRQTRYTLGGKVVGSWDKDAQGNVALRFKAGALSADKEKRLLELLGKFFD